MPYTLLLADDSITIQRIVELTFASEDISVVAFSDGEHAIASLDRRVPDIVLADIGMPGRSGYEVSRYIKNSPPLAHIPVLLLTGAFEPVDQDKAREAGCDGVLIKPFEPQFVISRVKELLHRPKGAAQEDEVEQYFEELDQAFANLSAAPPPPPAPEPEPEKAVQQPLAAATPGVNPMVSQPSGSDAPVGASPTLAGAFAALLAAERSGNGGAAPRGSAAPTPIKWSASDEMIDRISRRVLEQLSDTVVRETVAAIVQSVAERLVREEIERIKSNIK